MLVIKSRAIRFPRSTEFEVIAVVTMSTIALASIVEFLIVMALGASITTSAEDSVFTFVEDMFCVIIVLISSFRLSISCVISCLIFGVFAFLPPTS